MSGEADSYNLKREYFGNKINFKAKDDADSSKAASIKEDPECESKYIYINPRTVTLGNYVEKSYHSIHTEKTKTKSLLIKHVEGGWPETVENPNEPRQINNWKRAKEKKEDFPDKVRKLIANTEIVLKQNLRIDVYEEYFDTSKQKVEVLEDNFSAKIKTVFKDTCVYKRSVTKVVFSPEEQNKIAIAYKIKENESTILVDKSKLPCLIWDINNPNTPINSICSNNNTEINTCAFNNKHAHIFGVGCTNGTVLIYDLKTNKLLVTSKLEYCHSEAVRDFVWLKVKNGTEFVTTSTDGKVIWWDIRDLNNAKKIYLCPDNAEIKEPNKPDNEAEWIKNVNYKPFILVDKDKDTNTEKEYGGLKIEYNPEAGASKFLIVTEQGTIFLSNKKKNDADISQKYGFSWGRHLGPITGIQRCPHVNKYFLTVGDWTARIWPDDYKIPIYVSKYHPAYLMDCCWCPGRTGVFFVIRADGWLLAYDICYKTHDYVFSHKICESALTTMAINIKGDKVIIGDDDGVVSLVKLSKAFYDVDHSNETEKRDFITSMMEREVAREKGIEQILKRKSNPPKDESAKLLKQEQEIKKKLERIEQNYIPFVNEILHKGIEK